MLRTKKDVEKHVTCALSKIDNENERKLRGYTCARLYFQVKDYENAKRYLSTFLSVRDHHAPSHKLMAEIYEATGNIETALQCYKRSLEIDPQQKEVVLKICEMYCQLPVDHETACYWADRAEQIFPHHETVFRLRECLVSAEGEPDRGELEKLIATELAAQPKNVDLRIKLLRLYLDTERVKEAYDHAIKIESKSLFPNSTDWYYLLGDIFEAYQEEFNKDLDTRFYINFLTSLDHLMSLTVAEPHTLTYENGKKLSSINDAAAVLLSFDQQLKKAIERDVREGSWVYFLHHMKGQLYFQMASLLMKRAKKDQGNWKEACRFSSALFLIGYTFKPVNLLQEIWFSKMEDNQKLFSNLFQQGALRTSYTGHVIMNLCNEDKSKWLQKIKHDVCLPQVRERIYQRLFGSVSQKEKLSSSYFIQDPTFVQCSLEFPSNKALLEYNLSTYKLCCDSLHHLVWLQLQQDIQGSKDTSECSLSGVFKGLQYSHKNLSNGSAESLCVLDFEAYLQATTYQAKDIVERKVSMYNERSQHSPLCFPPDITDSLCSKQQANWWHGAYGLFSCSISEKFGEHRRNLQHGLEVIRGVGNHGLEVPLVVHLAHYFENKSNILSKKDLDTTESKMASTDITALETRATHYWNIAIGLLDKLSSGQVLRVPKDQMFVGGNQKLGQDEIQSLKEEGKLYLAVTLMNSEKLDEAAEILGKLVSPFASFYLSLILKKTAFKEEKSSNARTVLLNKAKNALHETMDRIKDNKDHTLNKEIYLELEAVECELAKDHNSSYYEVTDEVCDETDAYDDLNITPVHNTSFGRNGTPSRLFPKSESHSTPRPSSSFMSQSKHQYLSKERSHHIQPSPERLDAQIRALALNQDTLVKTLLQQQQALLDTSKAIVEGLKQNKDVVEQVTKQLEEIQLSNFKFFTRRSKKSSLMKGQGDDEDDYEYDANGLLEYYGEENGDDFRTSGAYGFDAPRMVHDAAVAPPPMNYVVSPAMQPGPPPLGHFNYPYSALAPAPPAGPVATAERSYYHPGVSQGLPFSEGQQLPQFQFHVASPIVKPPPPGGVISLPPQQALPPPSGIPPAAVIPQAQIPGIAASQWLKPVGVPHAFQIPLPAVGMVAPPPTTATILPPQVPLPQQVAPPSELKSMLSPQVTEGSLSFGPAGVKSPVAMQLPSPSMFAGLNTSPQYKNRSRCDSDVIGSDVEAHDLEREVMGDFKPLIPLPAEVVVETGEENEEVLFEDRAKLYRFVDQEWKERGIGVVKMLHHESSGRVRLLMRRDQVLKVCANHYITSKMEINAMKSSDRAWTWVAQDFADEELKPESFCIRFKTTDIAVAFKNAFEKSLAIAKQAEQLFSSAPKSASGKSPKVTTTQESSFGSKFAPKAGSWTCPTCYVSNTAERRLCVACETQKPGLHSAVTSPSSEIRPVVSSVTSKPFVFQSAIGSTAASQGPFVANKLEQQTAGQKPFSIFSKSNTLTPVTEAAKNMLGGFTFTSSPTIQEMKDVEADREILVVSTKSKNGPQVTKLSTPKTSPFSGFSFKSPPSTLPASWSVGSSTVTTVDSTSGVSKVAPISVYSFKSPASAQTASAVTFSSDSTSTDEDSTSTTVDSSSASQEVPKTKEPEKIFGSNSAVKSVDFATLSADPGLKGTKELSSVLGSASPLIVTLSKDGRRVSSDGVGENAPEEFIPTVDFKPVVPLPALVDVKTGEENEEKLFGERAKLFRYNSELKEWKERGIGELKILHQSENQKYRILMRRDQVLKLCANHYILPDMKLTPLNNNEKSYSWFAQDFSEGDLRQEQFAVRFKTGDLAKQFFDVFTKCQSMMRTLTKTSVNVCDNETIPKDPCSGNSAKFSQVFRPVSEALSSASVSSDQKPLSTLFRPEPDSWECNCCYIRNKSSDVKCVSCDFVKADIKPTTNEKPVYGGKPSDTKQQSFGNMFIPQSGSWACNCCYVMNKSSDMKCVACGFIKSDNQVTPNDKTVFGSKPLLDERQQSFDNLFKPQPGTWECQSCLVRNSADKTSCVSCQTAKSGSSITKPAASSAVFEKFQFATLATTPTTKPAESSNQGIFGKLSFGASNLTPTTASPFSFKAAKPGEFVFGMPAKSQPSTFSFGMTSVKSTPDEKTGFKPNLGDNTSSAPAIFGGAMQNSISPSKPSAAIPIATTTTTSTTGFNFGTAASEAPTKFCFGSPQKYEFSFSGVRARSPSKTPKSPRSPAAPSDVEDDEDVESSDVDNIYFQPVIPLPPKVETKTGEEDEKVLFCKRAKLFRFIDREWKERGIGDIKILLDESQRKVRLLMRRDQVLKVCLNHYLTREITFDWRGEKSITWAATDFSEAEPSPELFAVRFKTQEIAAEFKAAIDEANDVAESKSATPKINEAPSSVNNPAKSFSFKMDSDKNEMTASSSFSLASRFGTSAVPTKSLFGNTSPSQSDAQPHTFGAKTPFTFTAKESLPSGFFDPKPTDSDSPDSTSSEQSFKFDIDSKLSETKDIQRTNEEIEVIYQALSDPRDVAEAKRLLLPPTFFLYKLKEPCKGCIGCEDFIPPYRGDIAESQDIEISTSSAPATDVQSVFPNATASTCSFADLVADKPGFVAQTPKQSSPSSSKAVFAGAGTPLFANLNNSEVAGEDDDSVAQCPDIHFEPVIPLPELVVVKTGEEDETPVFVNRAKLYRFDTPIKQWKERGVGELKILQHKHKLSFRIILRRDQVHKIACNHCITADMELNPMNTSESSLCWFAMDYSEGDGVASQFAVKFKTKEMLLEFKAQFEECKTKLSESKETGETHIQQITTGVSEIKTAENVNQQIAFDGGATNVAPNSNNIPQSSGIEGQQEEEEDLEDEEDEIMFEKRVSLSIFDETTKSFQKAGMGCLRIYYDDEVFGYHITMTGDNETILCDHIIAIQTSLRVDKKIATWSAIDLSIEPPRTRQFQATFSSVDSIEEFSQLFEDGKDAAVHSEIVEKSDYRLPSDSFQS